MTTDEEKKIIYSLMKEIVEERRQLNKQYCDLKNWLTNLDKKNISKDNSSQKNNVPNINNQKKFVEPISTFKTIPFERIVTYITEILLNSDIPLSNKQLHNKINETYEINITYSNLTNNILPKINENKKIPVTRAYRGFWQYKKEPSY